MWNKPCACVIRPAGRLNWPRQLFHVEQCMLVAGRQSTAPRHDVLCEQPVHRGILRSKTASLSLKTYVPRGTSPRLTQPFSTSSRPFPLDPLCGIVRGILVGLWSLILNWRSPSKPCVLQCSTWNSLRDGLDPRTESPIESFVQASCLALPSASPIVLRGTFPRALHKCSTWNIG